MILFKKIKRNLIEVKDGAKLNLEEHAFGIGASYIWKQTPVQLQKITIWIGGFVAFLLIVNKFASPFLPIGIENVIITCSPFVIIALHCIGIDCKVLNTTDIPDINSKISPIGDSEINTVLNKINNIISSLPIENDLPQKKI